MIFQIVSFLLEVASGFLGGACLLRLMMQLQYVPFSNPVGKFVFAVTDWVVLPLRKVIPPVRRWDMASLVAAYLLNLAHFAVLVLLLGRGLLALPVLALFGVVHLVLSGLSVLLVVHVILSWVRTGNPVEALVERLSAPLLAPLRKFVPLVGGVDLSPLVALVVLQVAAIVVSHLQGVLLR